MTPTAIVVRSRWKSSAPHAVSAIQPPPTIAASSSTKPMTETSVIFPGRMYRRYTPMNSAMGIVIDTENTPHGLSPSALTTTSARIATMMITMSSDATIAAVPPTRPSS